LVKHIYIYIPPNEATPIEKKILKAKVFEDINAKLAPSKYFP
jgi:hypothetical protein